MAVRERKDYGVSVQHGLHISLAGAGRRISGKNLSWQLATWFTSHLGKPNEAVANVCVGSQTADVKLLLPIMKCFSNNQRLFMRPQPLSSVQHPILSMAWHYVNSIAVCFSRTPVCVMNRTTNTVPSASTAR